MTERQKEVYTLKENIFIQRLQALFYFAAHFLNTFDVILSSFQRFTPTILGTVLTWILFNFCASAQSDGRRVFDRRPETKAARHGTARAAPT